jgi:hypothetical protein
VSGYPFGDQIPQQDPYRLIHEADAFEPPPDQYTCFRESLIRFYDKHFTMRELEMSQELIQQMEPTYSLAESEINQQIATAKKYPRDLTQFRQDAKEMVTVDEDSAGSMFYCLKRKAKDGSESLIEGPSVRFAEVIACCYGNLKYGSRVIAETDTQVIAEGVCYDLQRNISVSKQHATRITYSNGRKYNQDMINMAGNAAASTALRNAIMTVVPKAFTADILATAKQASIGDADSLLATRNKAVDYFVKAGATQTQVLQAIGRDSVNDITKDDVVTLRGLWTSLKEGGNVEEVLGITTSETDANLLNEFAEKIGKCETAQDIDDVIAVYAPNGGDTPDTEEMVKIGASRLTAIKAKVQNDRRDQAIASSK